MTKKKKLLCQIFNKKEVDYCLFCWKFHGKM